MTVGGFAPPNPLVRISRATPLQVLALGADRAALPKPRFLPVLRRMLPQRSGVARRDPEGSERVQDRSKPRLFPVCAVPISAGGTLRLTSSSTCNLWTTVVCGEYPR